MPDDDRKPSMGDSLKSLQGAASKAGPAAAASYSLIGAIVVLGGAGYGIDAWRGTSPWGVMIGLGLGMVVGFYELIKSTRQKP
jgi:F0F1-type ATP synthase assembly protein I